MFSVPAALRRTATTTTARLTRRRRPALDLTPRRGVASTKPPAARLPTVQTCPSPTCACADMPAMPEGLEIDRTSPLDGVMAAYAEQVLVCTGRDDWASRIEDESGGDNLAADLKELLGRGGVYRDPFHNVSVLNASLPSTVPPRPDVQNTSAYLFPSFKYVPFLPRVSFDSVQALAKGFLLPSTLHAAHDGLSPIHRDRLTRKDAYQGLLPGVQDVRDVLVLVCGHGGRDARCGIMGPLLRAEFGDKLAKMGVDVRTGPVEVALGEEQQQSASWITGGATTVATAKTTARIGLISHIGGHKFAGNVIIYLPPGLRGLDGELQPLAGHGICFAIGTAAYYYLFTPEPRSKTLNRDTFVPYTITAREAISPTSAILTVSPRTPDPSPPYLRPGSASLWRHALWSVEFKQPEVQIARHYTPLPPVEGDEDAAQACLRFYIRAMGGGEMSSYLSRLGRLGSRGRVVFLAGGTGLVPAMQVARAVLDASDETTMTLLWAVRKRDEVQVVDKPAPSRWSSWWSTKAPTQIQADLADPSPIARHLKRMKARYGDRLDIRVAIDQEGTTIREADVEKALLLPPPPAQPTPPCRGCPSHDQRLHIDASEFDASEAACRCPSSDSSRARGKNLLMVSGPDGFVSHYAGPKAWLRGTLTQGPVGGVARRLQGRHARLADEWLVLKL
ncbi:sucrase/ferredoxin-like domain-containing protein [Hirsutella rhossiliensis]|uniref:Altered inheritance of mitochondria protein 32 n=1 Tax=Hirsutella rhossiliensis TaxID=111463 RepID=A0A9P8MZF7_9HYPO|nr:sucrase/ferredoxin-like domain-containing protein [Hirsutella rhossiliensis]KAH0965288.1 sucrase/ferredoxin-like domain-containing protein [Hirsutella rhossiliensis]